MKRGITFVLCFIILAGFASAELFIDQPNALYNAGDIVSFNVSLSSNIEAIGFLNVYLVCGANQAEIYKSVQITGPDNSKTTGVDVILDNLIMPNIGAECYIKASYLNEESVSQSFEVSRNIKVNFEIAGVSFAPNDYVNISGTAVKRNGELLNGFSEITLEGILIKVAAKEEIIINNTNVSEETGEEEEIDSEDENSEEDEDSEEEIEESESESGAEENVTVIIKDIIKDVFTNVSVIAEVRNGVFSTDLIIPEFTPPGSYKIKIRAYEQDLQGQVINEGFGSGDVRVKQVIKRVDVAFDNPVIVPGNNISYTLLLYDQAEGVGVGEGELTIYDPEGNVKLKKIAKAGESNLFAITSNSTPGYWEVEARNGEINSSSLFFVEEFFAISSRIEDGLLVIENIGNVIYSKPVEITIGEKSEIKAVNLAIGEKKKFRLEAPDGEYEIEVNDGLKMQNLGTTFLTGKAISIGDLDKLLPENYLAGLWFLIIAIIMVAIFILLKRVIKKKYIGKMPKLISTKNSLGQQSKEDSYNFVDRGEKEEVAIVSVKIKNQKDLDKAVFDEASRTIDRALVKAKSRGAKVYFDGDYRILIFSSRLTKEHDNNLRAVSTANEIDEMLEAYNNSFSSKIIYGIGVHAGDMAVESKEGNLKFVSLGNTMPIVKRISEMASSEILLSEEVHIKTLGKVKVEKTHNNFWMLKKIVGDGDYDEFIHKFLDRQKNKSRMQ